MIPLLLPFLCLLPLLSLLPTRFLQMSNVSYSMSTRLSHYEIVAHDFAIRASTSTHTHLHIAFIYARGGALIGMSTNRIGSRSRGSGYSDYTIHAERAAMKAVGDESLLRGATMVVVRVSRGGKLLGSEPCPACKCHLGKAMREYGLRRVYYS